MQVRRQLTQRPLPLLVSTIGLTGALLLSSTSLALSCPFSKGLGDAQSGILPKTGDTLTSLISGQQPTKLGKVGLILAGGLGLVTLAGISVARKFKQGQSPDLEPTTSLPEPATADLVLSRYAFPIVVPSEALESHRLDIDRLDPASSEAEALPTPALVTRT
jgi:hypothetical protein